MSSGLDCYFQEINPGEWYLFLEEDYGYKLDPEYDKYGPFKTFAEARSYLQDNFANPGGYSVYSLDPNDFSWEDGE